MESDDTCVAWDTVTVCICFLFLSIVQENDVLNILSLPLYCKKITTSIDIMFIWYQLLIISYNRNKCIANYRKVNNHSSMILLGFDRYRINCDKHVLFFSWIFMSVLAFYYQARLVYLNEKKWPTTYKCGCFYWHWLLLPMQVCIKTLRCTFLILNKLLIVYHIWRRTFLLPGKKFIRHYFDHFKGFISMYY